MFHSPTDVAPQFLWKLGVFALWSETFSWWQGWPSGESTGLSTIWPGFDFRTRCHMWIEFVGSLRCYERFSPGTPVFPSHQKPNI